ncbi:MAG: hypothetical protein JSR58_04005 [Verrucomicrobia bacterium]|nr:hypothetical protein [Verrucomicrobiota bacterium]
MKRLAILSAILTSAAFADIQSTSTTPAKENPHQISAGVDAFWQRLKTRSYTDNGAFIGSRFSYQYIKPDALYFGLEAMLAEGRVKTEYEPRFDFWSWSYHKKPNAHFTSYWLNTETRMGYAFQLSASSITPFIGFGYTSWEPIKNQHYFMDWFYTTAGVRINQKLSDRVDFGLNTKINYAFKVKHHARRNFPGEKFWGYEVGVPVTLHVNEAKTHDIQLQPYFQCVDIKSNFFNLGGRLDFIFRF